MIEVTMGQNDPSDGIIEPAFASERGEEVSLACNESGVDEIQSSRVPEHMEVHEGRPHLKEIFFNERHTASFDFAALPEQQRREVGEILTPDVPFVLTFGHMKLALHVMGFQNGIKGGIFLEEEVILADRVPE